MKIATGLLALSLLSLPAVAVTPLSDLEMGGITAQSSDRLSVIDPSNIQANPNIDDFLEQSLEKPLALIPGLSYDYRIEGVVWPETPRIQFSDNGRSVTISGPESIDRIRIDNLRASPSTPVIGNIIISNIRLHEFNATVRLR